MADDTKIDERRTRTLRFRATKEEAQAIEQRAATAGLSVSAYLRAAGLNHPIRSVLDLHTVADLVKVTATLAGSLGW